MNLIAGKTIGPKIAKTWNWYSKKAIDCPCCDATCGQRDELTQHLRNRHNAHYVEMMKENKKSAVDAASLIQKGHENVA